MRVEETVHYDQRTTSGQKEWPYTRPQGSGNVRLGSGHQLYIASAFHQMHCIELFSAALIGDKEVTRGHLQHCLNYMREVALCRPDLTLEPGDFTERNFTTDRVGATHICRDWEAEYEAVASNTLEWVEFKKTYGVK
ncbi:hypothetical protein HGRIS_006060 [Hohenbuehelia grisea]|uniref:Uncharacterized protein n=1 Tax=Hohenbuehelia grisea TaxID=104357 RepID=A0ABR3JZ10_9AGAR